jgi:putative oxidoreductase
MQISCAIIANSLADVQEANVRHLLSHGETDMDAHRTAPYAALLLRVGLGVMFLAHGLWLKAFVFGLPGTAAFFASVGLPGLLAYLVFAAETVGGMLLIVGLYTRPVALALLPILLGATWVHWPNGWLFTNPDGGFEYPLFLWLAAGVQALLGDGAYAVSRRALAVRLARA